MKPHICILGLINESNLGMGRQLLSECVTGEENNRIKKLKLNKLIHYETLPLYDKKDVFEILDILLYKKYIKYKAVKSNKFIRVLELTKKGLEELNNPSDEYLKLAKLNAAVSLFVTQKAKSIDDAFAMLNG